MLSMKASKTSIFNISCSIKFLLELLPSPKIKLNKSRFSNSKSIVIAKSLLYLKHINA